MSMALRPGKPRLILAADAREAPEPLTPPGDVVWWLYWRDLPPSTVALETNLGLRVHLLAFFPAFQKEDGTWLLDAGAYIEPPQVVEALPDYARVEARPFSWLAYTWEVAVEAGTRVHSRVTLRNLNNRPRKMAWAWVGLLRPLYQDADFMPWPRKSGDVLKARLSEGVWVFYLTAGPQAIRMPYPALRLEHELSAEQSLTVYWVALLALGEEEGLTLARRVAARPWAALHARREIRRATVPMVHLGRREDALLAHGLRRAWHFPFRPPQDLKWFLLLRREPETSWVGELPRREMPSYPQIWYWVTQYGLPSLQPWLPAFLEGLVQMPNPRGEPDGRPAPWGAQGRFLAHPLMVDAVARVAWLFQERPYLERLFPRLMSYLARWFASEHDRDQDDWPEWEHHLQMGWELPLEKPCWRPWSALADLRAVESPALLAFLYRAVAWMEAWAVQLGEEEARNLLSRWKARLQGHWMQAWNARRSLAPYRDRDTHFTHPGRVLWRGRGSGTFSLNLTFSPAMRPVVYLRMPRDRFPAAFTLTLHGRDAHERHHTERLNAARFRRLGREAVATASTALSTLEQIHIEGLPKTARVILRTVDLTSPDLSLLTPLWAGLATQDQARRMVARYLDEKGTFWSPGGWTWTSSRDCLANVVPLWWNVLLLEGLLRYGFYALAVRRLETLLDHLFRQWEREGRLYAEYSGDTGVGLGEGESLPSLPPLGLLLEMSGLRPLPGLRLALVRPPLFRYPVVVRLWQVEIHRAAEETDVRTPWGETLRIPSHHRGILDIRGLAFHPTDRLLQPWPPEPDAVPVP